MVWRRDVTTVFSLLKRAQRYPRYLMLKQLLAHPDAEPDPDDQEPEAEPRSAIDLTALRALKSSRSDVEALDLTDDGCAASRTPSPRRLTTPTRVSLPGRGRSAAARRLGRWA
ncbi:hypothetical protein ACFU5O_33575 [Streptomyces sp. NPDC057445]|uniref:hypothetical protein n=1 Tax=Streptomyces sp. NPDC057445 TaxID=3346136 RepID=UPI0036B78A07